MIPLRDESPIKTVPFVNVLLILANTAVFVYQNFFFLGGPGQFFLRLGCIPYEFTHLTDIGPQAQVPLPLTLFTAMFVHGGLIHLLGNMLFLWIFGDNIEDKLGHIKYLCFYALCGFGASFTHILTNPHSQLPTVGASGAIAGVMGAYLWLFPRARIRTLLILGIFIQVVRIPAVVMLGYWILLQVLGALAEQGSGTGGGVAWFAHVGGFITGFLLIIVIKKRRR